MLGMAVLVLSALPIDAGSVPSSEADAFRFLNRLPEALYPVAWAVMQLGNVLAVPAGAIVAAVMRRWWLSFAIVVSGMGAWLLAKVVKTTVGRGRPAELLSDVVLRDAPATGHGYLSGHAAVVTAIATAATPYLSRSLRVVVWILVTITCLARVYVGAHLVLDVIV